MSSAVQFSEATSNYDHIYRFVEKFVFVHGASVESSLSTPSSVSTPGKQVAGILENVILGTITSTQDSLGDAWTRPSEQKNGQPAFETRSSPPKPKEKSNDSLGGLLSMLTVAADTCPVFLCHFPSLQGKDSEVDSLIRRAVESSVAALTDTAPSTIHNSITFLSSMVRCYPPISDFM